MVIFHGASVIVQHSQLVAHTHEVVIVHALVLVIVNDLQSLTKSSACVYISGHACAHAHERTGASSENAHYALTIQKLPGPLAAAFTRTTRRTLTDDR